jgi:flagellar export protein FliJ
MKKFHFPLARVLSFRRLQRDLERAKMEKALCEIARIEEIGHEIRREAESTTRDLLGRGESEPLDGTQLMGLDDYRKYLRRVAAEVDLHRRRAEVAAANQRVKLIETERRVKVLEHLEATTRQEWKAALNKEIEDFAGEAFLARRIREGSPRS